MFKISKLPILSIIFATSLFAFANLAWATRTQGRLEVGGLAATERFSRSDFGSDKNDNLVLSFRSYYAIEDIGESRWTFKSDLRDKYDFFDKLNRELLQLDANNTFQVRELSAHKPVLSASGWAYSIGRFSVPEAGAVFADGGMLERKIDAEWATAVFAGLNPKPTGQSYLTWNPETLQYGAFVKYVKTNTEWDKNFSSSHALVNQSVKGETDRTYLYQNVSYLWSRDNQLVTNIFLDFVPRTYVQHGSLYWRQAHSQRFFTKVNLLGVDVVEYARIQNVRERLPSSPYRQGSLVLGFNDHGDRLWEFSLLRGSRDIDGLSKTEYTLSLADQTYFGPKWETTAALGYRDNFTSIDSFIRLGTSYFSRFWEWNVIAEAGVESAKNNLPTKHPVIVELAASNIRSRVLFWTASLQSASDEDVQIWTAFFKLGYRFGNTEIPPLRDGAPPRVPM